MMRRLKRSAEAYREKEKARIVAGKLPLETLPTAIPMLSTAERSGKTRESDRVCVKWKSLSYVIWKEDWDDAEQVPDNPPTHI
jgi:hypothetical protein